MFLSYTEESKAYRIWDFTKNKVVITRDIICNKQDPLLISSQMETQATPSPKTLITLIFNSPPLPPNTQPRAPPHNIPSSSPARQPNPDPQPPPSSVQISPHVSIPETVPLHVPLNTADNLTHDNDPLGRLDLHGGSASSSRPWG